MRRSMYGPNARGQQFQGLADPLPVTECHRSLPQRSEPWPSGSAAASRLISSQDAASALYGPASFAHFFDSAIWNRRYARSRAASPSPPTFASSSAADASPSSSSRRMRCCVTSQTVRRLSVVGSQSGSSSSRSSRRTLPPPDLTMPARTSPSTLDVLRPAQVIRTSVSALVHAILRIPGDGPASVLIELALLLGRHFVEHLVDQGQSASNAMGSPLGSTTLA